MFELLWVWAETNDGFYSMNQDYSPDFWDVKIKGVPSGKLLHNYGKIHHFPWENPLFLSISMAIVNSKLLVYQAGYMILTPNRLWTMICSTQVIIIRT